MSIQPIGTYSEQLCHLTKILDLRCALPTGNGLKICPHPNFQIIPVPLFLLLRSNALSIGQNLRMTHRGTKKRVLFHKLELYETSYLVASSANNLHVNHHQSFGEKHFAHVIKILATRKPKQHYIVTNNNFSLI